MKMSCSLLILLLLQLFSVQETKGPISRAKMAKITAIAIKTVKFYKHVVHGVEKFIQKVGSHFNQCSNFVF